MSTSIIYSLNSKVDTYGKDRAFATLSERLSENRPLHKRTKRCINIHNRRLDHKRKYHKYISSCTYRQVLPSDTFWKHRSSKFHIVFEPKFSVVDALHMYQFVLSVLTNNVHRVKILNGNWEQQKIKLTCTKVLQLPWVAKYNCTSLNTRRWSFKVILCVTIEITTQTLNISLPHWCQFNVNSCSSVPLNL